MQWKFSGGSPVYVQIMEHMRMAILAGQFPPGARIPPVRDLAVQAGVNPNTMQRAMMELERENILIACGTVGRFVTNDTQVLETLRKTAIDAMIRSTAEQLRSLGLELSEAAALLLALEKEETHE